MRIEKGLDERVHNEVSRLVDLEIFFRHVGCLRSTVDEYVIPRLIAIRLGLIGFVPFR